MGVKKSLGSQGEHPWDYLNIVGQDSETEGGQINIGEPGYRDNLAGLPSTTGAWGIDSYAGATAFGTDTQALRIHHHGQVLWGLDWRGNMFCAGSFEQQGGSFRGPWVSCQADEWYGVGYKNWTSTNPSLPQGAGPWSAGTSTPAGTHANRFQYAVAHGLGREPDFFDVQFKVGGDHGRFGGITEIDRWGYNLDSIIRGKDQHSNQPNTTLYADEDNLWLGFQHKAYPLYVIDSRFSGGTDTTNGRWFKPMNLDFRMVAMTVGA